MKYWGYHEVVGTLDPYIKQKNFFELFALAARMQKLWARAIASEPPGATSIIFFFAFARSERAF